VTVWWGGENVFLHLHEIKDTEHPASPRGKKEVRGRTADLCLSLRKLVCLKNITYNSVHGRLARYAGRVKGCRQKNGFRNRCKKHRGVARPTHTQVGCREEDSWSFITPPAGRVGTELSVGGWAPSKQGPQKKTMIWSSKF